MRKMEYDNPFCQGELSNLGFAREEKDVEYLIEWSKQAVKQYENEANENRHDAIKWRHLISSLSEVVERKDLVTLEFGPEDLSSTEDEGV